MTKHLLSFVTNEHGDMITIHSDIAGLTCLIERLTLLRNLLSEGDCPHSHLWVEPLGSELSETRCSGQANEVNVVQHVKIYGWTDEWAVRHGLRLSQE